MKRSRNPAILILLLAFAASCASVGAGDPLVVRAEDLLTNSLTVYSQIMDTHSRHSTQESPAIYRLAESFRVRFPACWTALDNAKRDYKKNKALGTSRLEAALTAMTDLLKEVAPLIQHSELLNPHPWQDFMSDLRNATRLQIVGGF